MPSGSFLCYNNNNCNTHCPRIAKTHTNTRVDFKYPIEQRFFKLEVTNGF